MFNSSSADQHQPPSSLASGRFLTLLALLSIMVGSGLAISRHVYNVCHDVLVRHEWLLAISRQADEVSGRLDRLSQAKPGSADEKMQLNQFFADLDPASAHFLADISSELPAETADVEQAIAGLKSAVRTPDREGHGAALLQGKAGAYFAAAHLERTLDKLRSGVGRLEDDCFHQSESIQQLRLLAVVCQALAWLLILIAFGYAAQLYRRLRREELARFHIESELAAERAALERRVQARTFALEAEVQERLRAERLNRGRNRMLEMVARNEPIAEIFNVLTETVAEFRSTWTCAVHSLSPGSLKLMASSGMSDKIKQHLKSISTGFAGAPESIALASGEPYLVEDLGAVHKPWSELLRANGLLSVWSAPFFASGSDALGTISVYTLLQWKPSSADLEMLEMARHMAALVLEKKPAADAVDRSCLSRQPDRPAQSPVGPGPHRECDQAGCPDQPGNGGSVDRPRPVQADQRSVWASGRRCGAAADRGAALWQASLQRHAGAHGRR